MKKFCDIQSRNELADYLSVPRNKLTHILLSPKACQGILRRASARGKELPEVLRIALEQQASA